ncbi:CBS domain-containing protein, partial [Candidatus Bathyarchaeota archaeon]
STDVKVVRPDTSVKEIVAMHAGIITERDILRRIVGPCLPPETLRAREVMTSPVTSIHSTSSIDEAARVMVRKHVKRLLVMSGETPVGILTFTDIVTQVPNMLGILEELLRPHHRVH